MHNFRSSSVLDGESFPFTQILSNVQFSSAEEHVSEQIGQIKHRCQCSDTCWFILTILTDIFSILKTKVHLKALRHVTAPMGDVCPILSRAAAFSLGPPTCHSHRSLGSVEMARCPALCDLHLAVGREQAVTQKSRYTLEAGNKNRSAHPEPVLAASVGKRLERWPQPPELRKHQ